MPRLIDANRIVYAWIIDNDGEEHGGVTFQSLIEKMPTVDAVEVVRCKDCRYMTEHYDTDGNVPYWTCSEWDSGTDYDGYCHFGERREDAR